MNNKIYFKNVCNISYKLLAKKILNFTLDVKSLNNKCFSLCVKFVSQNEIKNLNKNFRNVDKATDVLSFPFYNNTAEFEEEDFVYLGDIAICKDIAKFQAKEYKHSLKRELCFLFVHGLLHLLGYDHIEKEEEQVMNELAENILNENGVVR